MSSKIIVKITCVLVLISLLIACNNFRNIEYTNPINTMTSIKKKSYQEEYYGRILLTMEKYWAFKKETIASFRYKDKKASVKIKFHLKKNKLEFIRIGEESDHFLLALAELFEEKLENTKMKESLLVFFSQKGDSPKINLFGKVNTYALSYYPNSDAKGSVSIRMIIDMEKGEIEFWEKNGGIAKRNLVKAFEE